MQFYMEVQNGLLQAAIREIYIKTNNQVHTSKISDGEWQDLFKQTFEQTASLKLRAQEINSSSQDVTAAKLSIQKN